MILFVFEGDNREPYVYKTLERLYFPKDNDNIICSFGNNIYDLYSEMENLDGDVDFVSVLREHLTERGDIILDGKKSADISEIYLFFDFDFQNSQLELKEINTRVEKLLNFFDDETENGKLYINYPMIESIRYTKELPDDDYVDYVVNRDDCLDFKHLASDFSFYDSFDHILFKEGERPTKEKYNKIKDNWAYLKTMNVCKANFIISEANEMPKDKYNINQQKIFNAQKEKYIVPEEKIAILNSFPIFIYEYMK